MSAKSFKEATVALKGYIFSEHRNRHLNQTKKKQEKQEKNIPRCESEDHYQQELKSPLSDQNLLNKSTFKCENCKVRIFCKF